MEGTMPAAPHPDLIHVANDPPMRVARSSRSAGRPPVAREALGSRDFSPRHRLGGT